MQKIERKQHNIDAKGIVLGRLASQIAGLLRGKGKVSFLPHVDGGDEVSVYNLEQIKITGNKLEQKVYHRHSGYPGGLKEISMKALFTKDPCLVFKKAVWNMLPKNKLRSKMIIRLKLYSGEIK